MKIALFTARYPYGVGETFIENELEVLSVLIDHIYLIPNQSEGKARNSFQFKNVSVVNLNRHCEGAVNLSKLELVRVFLFEVLHRNVSIGNMRYDLSLMRNAEKNAASVKAWLDSIEGTPILYSYWFNDWSTVLSILKYKGLIKSYISRAHGFDLYRERSKTGLIPWRYFQLKNVDSVFAISKQGRTYLENNYPNYLDKFQQSYLGTRQMPLGPIPVDGEIHVLSCSSVIPLKRVGLILKAVQEMRSVTWTHFGDGSDFETLKSNSGMIDNPDVNIVLKGHCPNTEVLKFISENAISCFVNVSTTEGLPVSIMEALSFGIPVIVTDVGGVSEMISATTGVLLDSNPEVHEIKDSIERLARNMNDEANRQAIQDVWKKNFSAEANYREFLKNLK
jgi:glycosyltransferase involved in cell wall biosynthesis